MYGKVMSISDRLMHKYYELLSTVDLARLQEIREEKVHPLEAKKQLANELVTRFHGEAAAAGAAEDFTQRFQRRELPSEIETFAWSGEEETGLDLPTAADRRFGSNRLAKPVDRFNRVGCDSMGCGF